MRTIYMGTGDIGLPALRWLLQEPSCEVVGVFTQPDRPFGRKMELKPPAVKELATAAGVPVFQPEKLRAPEAMADLEALEPDLIVVMAHGQILKKAVLDLPRLACINLHASLLPRHRGASPIQAALLAGDTETGITVMHVDVGLDTGDMILKETIPIAPDETGGSLHDRLAGVAPVALARAVSALAAGTAERTPQDEDDASYLGKLTREDGLLDWSRPAPELERRIRAFDPWPGTYTLWEGRKLKLYPPAQVKEGGGEAGEIRSVEPDRIIVACGEGGLSVGEVQLEGRKRMPVRAFLAGHGDSLRAGLRFG